MSGRTIGSASQAPGKATADSDIVDGRFVEVVPGRRVVQEADFVSDDPAFAGTMTMTWTVTDNVPDGISADDHRAGLESSLSNLAAHLEQ